MIKMMKNRNFWSIWSFYRFLTPGGSKMTILTPPGSLWPRGGSKTTKKWLERPPPYQPPLFFDLRRLPEGGGRKPTVNSPWGVFRPPRGGSKNDDFWPIFRPPGGQSDPGVKTDDFWSKIDKMMIFMTFINFYQFLSILSIFINFWWFFIIFSLFF